MTTSSPPTPRPARTAPWTEAEILAGLASSRRFVERALLALYNRQSPAERDGQDTEVADGMGFSRFDKPFMSSLATWMLDSPNREGARLTERQLRAAIPVLRRYRRQLVEIANRNEVAAAAEAGRFVHDGRFCPACHGSRVVTRNFLGEAVVEPCPQCGDTPYADRR